MYIKYFMGQLNKECLTKITHIDYFPMSQKMEFYSDRILVTIEGISSFVGESIMKELAEKHYFEFNTGYYITTTRLVY